MRAMLESMKSYQLMNDESDLLKLILAIKGVVFKVNDKSYH